jgi:hypothetical protein
MASITDFGCIACYLDGHPNTPGAVHHLLRGGLRLGHLFSICLCDPGHHQNGAVKGVVSRHPDKAAFERRYGNEADLLELMRRLVGASFSDLKPLETAKSPNVPPQPSDTYPQPLIEEQAA